MHDLIISDFLVPPGMAVSQMASLSHIVWLLVWVSYYVLLYCWF